MLCSSSDTFTEDAVNFTPHPSMTSITVEEQKHSWFVLDIGRTGKYYTVRFRIKAHTLAYTELFQREKTQT